MGDRNETPLQTEKVIWLKGKIMGYQATLNLYHHGIEMTTPPTFLRMLGLIGLLFASFSKGKEVFSLSFAQIAKMEQGKHGINTNILELTDKEGQTYRIAVKDYSHWDKLLSSYLQGA